MAKLFKPALTQAAKMPVRNPILLEQEADESFKPSRMRVASYKDKPRGMAKGTFSLKNMGTISLAQEENVPEAVVPRKEVKNSPPQEPVSRKASGLAPPTRNPITLEGVPEEAARTRPSTTLSWRPSSVSEALNNRKYMMSSEQNPGKQRNTTRSDIFGLAPQEEAEAKPRLTLERPSQAGNLLQYKFAPSFKNDGVSAKPETQLLTAQDYQDFKVHRNQVELSKIKRNQSTF